MNQGKGCLALAVLFVSLPRAGWSGILEQAATNNRTKFNASITAPNIVALAGEIAVPAVNGAPAQDIAPDALVKNTTLEVLTVLQQSNGDRKSVLDLIETKVLPNFDFMHMTQLAVGRNWTKATSVQQQALTQEFRSLLVRTYSHSLELYKDQTIGYKPVLMSPGDGEATVRTLVHPPTGDAVSINYRMEKTAQGWKVFDVTIDGISLVTTYRTEFNTEIEKSSIDGLIKKLKEKTASPGIPAKS